MKRRFLGTCLKVQSGEEKFFVSELPSVHIGRVEVDRAGVFERVEGPSGTTAKMLMEFVGDVEETGVSAEEKANDALLDVNGGVLGSFDRKAPRKRGKKATTPAADDAGEDNNSK